MGIKHLSRVRINGHVLRPKTGTIPTVALPAYFTCSMHKTCIKLVSGNVTVNSGHYKKAGIFITSGLALPAPEISGKSGYPERYGIRQREPVFGKINQQSVTGSFKFQRLVCADEFNLVNILRIMV